MRPAIIALLDAHGLHAATWLVPTSGAVYFLMFLALGLAFRHRARTAGLSTTHAVQLWLVVAIAAAIGAHLFRLGVTGDWRRIPVTQWLSGTGTASWGDYLFGIAAVWIYAKANRLSGWIWLDLAIALQPLGEVIGRWACFLAGDDFGRVTQVPWAIRFPAGSYAWSAHLSRGLLESSAPWSLAVHPQQFYLMVNAAALLILMTIIWRRFRTRPGVTVGAFLMLYGVTRFGVEFFRDPAAGGAASGLSTSQWMCIIFTLAGGIVLKYRTQTAHG